MCECVHMCVHACMNMHMCVCERACAHACVYALRTVSTDEIVHFINTFIIINTENFAGATQPDHSLSSTRSDPQNTSGQLCKTAAALFSFFFFFFTPFYLKSIHISDRLWQNQSNRTHNFTPSLPPPLQPRQRAYTNL